MARSEGTAAQTGLPIGDLEKGGLEPQADVEPRVAISDPEKGQATEPSQAQRVASIIRTISRTSNRDPGPPPDGGFHAWLQVALVHISIINTWGFLNSFGFFQSYYVDKLQKSPSDISWVGSFQVWLLFAVGVLAGRATDAGYFKVCYAVGSLLLVLGLFMISLCTEYWQFFLAQGVCQGIGNGFIFIPVLTILPGYFVKNRIFAMAASACGTATGGMIYPGIIQGLLPRVGFQWTLRIIGFMVLVLQCVCLLLLRQRTPPRKSGPLVEWSAFREPSYSLMAAAFFMVNLGVWFAFDYVPSFASDVLHEPESTSNNLLLILNGLGIPGRLIPAFVADRYTGPVNILISFSFLGGVILLAWTSVASVNGMVGWCVVYGFCSAGFLGLFPATVASLTNDPKKMGVRMGMVFSIISFACLTGPPIAGAIIQKMDGDYLGAQVFAGTTSIVGCLIIVAARISKKGWRLYVKI